MTDIVASELCSAGLPETAKAYVAWCREAERRTAEAKAVVATCGRRDPGIPREASAMGVGAASRDVEVAGLRAELAGMTRTCEITLDTNGRLMAENAALHTEVTRLGVGLRQWQGRSAELQGMLDGTVRAPVLPTSANPEHVRRMAEVLRAAMNGAELSFEAEARAALDVLPELVGKS